MNNARPTGLAPKPRPNAGEGPYYAALDLGTNSCRMLIATPKGGHFQIVDAFSKSVRLGLELERTGVLSNAGISRTVQALHVCAKKLRMKRVVAKRLVATEACRRAANGETFMGRIKSETGLKLEIIKPSEEARLAVVGCAPLVSPHAKQVLVIDIGGGSTELVWIDLSHVHPANKTKAMMELSPGTGTKGIKMPLGAKIVDWISVPLGVATLLQRFSDVSDDAARFALMSCYFEEALEDFRPYIEGGTPENLANMQVIGTSGTITTVGAMHLGLKRYDRSLVDGMAMSATDVDRVVEGFLKLGPVGRREEPGIGRDRAQLIMSGSAILQTIVRIWPTRHIRVADRGLREGMLYSMMNADGAFEDQL